MGPMGDDAVAWVRAQRGPMEALLRALVEESSYTLDPRGVDAAGAVLREAIPLRCRAVPGERYGAHLFFEGRRPAGDGGVVLVGHHDTVFPREVFSGYRSEGDVAWGPGVLDMKGGLVVMAFALRALDAAGALERMALTMAVVADEEVGSPESAPWLQQAARGAAVALVFEAGREGDAIITRRKGTLAMTARAIGRAAHAGNAHAQGASAIRAMARFIESAEALNGCASGVTINVGTVHGGTSKNTVPAQCVAELDGRFERADDGVSLVSRLRDLVRSPLVEGTSVVLEGGIARAPLERWEESARWMQRYGGCQRLAGLGVAESPLQGGGSDASTTASVGVPSIDGLGPRGSGFHTLDERVELDSLVPKCEALVRFLLGVGGDGFSPPSA
ncbi:MAG: M20 family metallopeptidase [Deltaproteobacteria bacterium]|nr:M20 family metallopeptidase [Deltaproteobacteria bacterium]